MKLDALPLTGMLSSAEPLNKLEMLHFHVEGDPVRMSESADSDNLISFNTDEILDEGSLYCSIDSRLSCNARIDNVGNTGEQPQDGNLSTILDPAESRRGSSGIGVVYCEILDVSVRNQIANDFSSQENQLLGKNSQNDSVLEFVTVENSRHAELGQVRV